MYSIKNQELIIKGLCIKCQQPKEQNSPFCTKCKEENTLKTRIKREEANKKGLCICGDVLDRQDRKQCFSCRKKYSEAQKTKKRNKKEKGLCRCGNPLWRQQSRCKSCNEKERILEKERRKRRKVLGLCTKCGKEVFNSIYCSTCKNKSSVRWNENYRTNPNFRAKQILVSAKKKERQGYESDIDLGFVLNKLNNPCSYCGETELFELGLDRIDNTLGYLKSNVVTCCTCCNMIRRDMPYKAWLELSKSMKYIRESQLLGDWRPYKKKRGTN